MNAQAIRRATPRSGRRALTLSLFWIGTALVATVILGRSLIAEAPVAGPPAAVPKVPGEPVSVVAYAEQTDAAAVQDVGDGGGVPPVALPAAPVAPRPRLASRLPLWLRVTTETPLWSSASGGQEFTRLASGVTLRTLDQQGGRYRVHYPGDEEKRKPGEAWVNVDDVAEASWPRFVRTRAEIPLRAQPSEAAAVEVRVPARSYLEVLDVSGRDWAHVFLSARPDNGAPLDAWLDGEDAAAPPRDVKEFADHTLSRAGSTRMPDVWLPVPYRSQLDGSTYEIANCGPTVLWMTLQSLGTAPGVGQLRAETLRLQDIDECDDCGVFIEHLAAVGEQFGAEIVGLYDQAPDAFHRWTADEIRQQLRLGRVVVPQVMYRLLSGRDRSEYWGDHYVVVTGYVGDRFIYHDPVNTGGPGASRTIPTDRLMKAMEASDYPFAAYAVGSRASR